MAAAKPANELKALQERVAELEKQLRELKAELAAGRAAIPRWPDVPMSDEEAEAFHKSSQWVDEYIRKQREADRKRVNAQIDRLEKKEKGAAARQRKAAKGGRKARRAG
jgi:hypothetical protein